MKNLILSLLLSLTLTACSGGATGSDGRNGVTSTVVEYFSPDTETTHTVNPLGITATGSTTPEYANIDADYSSITALATQADTTNTALAVTLQGFAVSRTDTIIYKRTNNSVADSILWENGTNPKGLKIYHDTQLSRILSPTFNQSYMPAVTLRFADDGTMSAITAYADKEYMASDATISVDNTKIFGFTADYMAVVTWNKKTDAIFTQNDSKATPIETTINGMMLAGFATASADFPTTQQTTFTGKGKGMYRGFDEASALTDYETSFTATADVNFAERTLDISATGTKSTGETDRSHLDFKALNIGFTADDNHISTDIIAGSLYGTLDARIYGNAAQEFGGTFALNNADSSYHGAFGAERSNLLPVEDVKGLISFADSNRTDTDNITLNVDNAVYIDTTNRNTKNITGAVVEFSYDAMGDFVGNNADTGFKLFLTDKTYVITSANSTNSTAEVVAHHDVSQIAGDNPKNISLNFNRSSQRLGFTANYMAGIHWHLADDFASYGITGWESNSSDIITSGNATFTGRGSQAIIMIASAVVNVGNYYFDVNVTVDFNSRNVKAHKQ